MDSTDSDYGDDEESDGSPPPSPPPLRKSARVKRSLNYSEECVDKFFSDVKGYTHFQRTRKGGDKRPFAAAATVYNSIVLNIYYHCINSYIYIYKYNNTSHSVQKVIKQSNGQRTTLLNFFACGANKPLPLPACVPNKKKKKAIPKKTRVSKYGRPIKLQEPASTRQEKVQQLKKSVKRNCAAGSLTVTPTKRNKWSGSVLLQMFCYCLVLFWFCITNMYH